MTSVTGACEKSRDFDFYCDVIMLVMTIMTRKKLRIARI